MRVSGHVERNSGKVETCRYVEARQNSYVLVRTKGREMQSWRVISEGRRWMPGWKTVHKRDEEEHAHSVEQVKMSVRVICDRE